MIMKKPYYQQRKLPLTFKKSNELVRAQLRVENNVLANRIFYLLVREIEATQGFPKISVPVKELAIDKNQPLRGNQYKAIDAATDVLLKASVHAIFYNESETPIGFKKSNIFTDIDYKKGIITAKFNSSMKPHLLELKKRFTTLNYFELMDLPSFYSQRIYEILKSWENPDGLIELTLKVFYDMISYPKDLRNDFASVRRYALEKAEKDINTRTELRYRWEPIKEGKKVVAVRFIIGEQGKVTKRKMVAKEEDKKRKQTHLESADRKPYLKAASICRREHGIESGGTCQLMKLRSKKCQLCRQYAEVKSHTPTLF